MRLTTKVDQGSPTGGGVESFLCILQDEGGDLQKEEGQIQKLPLFAIKSISE